MMTEPAGVSLQARAAYRIMRSAVRAKRTRRGGPAVRYVGRAKLAALLSRSKRTVSRYTGELERAGLLVKVPARRAFRDGRWATLDVQGYILTMIALGPHPRRSTRGVTPVPSPPLRGARQPGGAPPGDFQPGVGWVPRLPARPPATPEQVAAQQEINRRGVAAARAALAAARANR